MTTDEHDIMLREIRDTLTELRTTILGPRGSNETGLAGQVHRHSGEIDAMQIRCAKIHGQDGAVTPARYTLSVNRKVIGILGTIIGIGLAALVALGERLGWWKIP